MTRRCFPQILLILLAAGAPSRAGDSPTPAITEAELQGHVRRLASDEWEGRGSGTPGEKHAAGYVADHFAALGLEPAGEGGTFFQEVKMPGEVKVDPSCRLELLPDADADAKAEAKAPVLELDKDWRPFSLFASGTVEGQLVFAGYGVHAPDIGYDDYAGLDVNGKIVVVFRHIPHGAPTWQGPRARQQYAPFLAKLGEAAKRGAIGLLVVNDPFHFRAPAEGQGQDARRARPDRVQGGNIGGGTPTILFAHVTLAGAQRWFPAAFGATPEELEAAIHDGGKPAPASRAGRARARLKVALERTFLLGVNVCALLRAGARDAVDEVVVVGAHHDHLGRGAPGSLARSAEERHQIHNGADDNASGTSGVLEVAANLAARRAELRRSILFLTFTGEERGLLGSRYFVEHPTVPLAKMVAMLNMDMIGRLEGKKLFIGGVKTSPVFRPVLETKCRELGLDVLFGDGGRAPSDNTSFYNKHLPVLFFFSGMHRDYHRPSDDADKIDLSGMARIAALCAATALEVAQLPQRPAFQRADTGGMGPPRPILGITAAAAAEHGVVVGGVAPDGPAATAGLQAGDVILSLDGEKTGDLAALRAVMRKKKIGDRVKLKYLRGGVSKEIELTLARG